MKKNRIGMALGAAATASVLAIGLASPAQAASNTWLDKQTRGYTTYTEPGQSRSFSRTGAELQVFLKPSSNSFAKLTWGSVVAQGSQTLQQLNGPRNNAVTTGYWKLKSAKPDDPGTIRMTVKVTGVPTGGMRAASPSAPENVELPDAVDQVSLQEHGVDVSTAREVGAEASTVFWAADVEGGGTALIAVDGDYSSVTYATAESFATGGIATRLDTASGSAEGVLLPEQFEGTTALEEAGLNDHGGAFWTGGAGLHEGSVAVEAAAPSDVARSSSGLTGTAASITVPLYGRG
ncbi:hypothetical protein [Curtobacterium sp. 1544]|uniref:hypothetical protein n=1 Tax=Curtobacterium sp. 1544 TaxID=3156417 RepID=UPI0033947D76